MKKIVIVGSGGLAKEIAFLIEDINKQQKDWDFLGYIDRNVGAYYGKFKVFNNDDWLENTQHEINVIFGIGDPLLLKKLVVKFQNNKQLKFPTLIHPNVIGDWDRIELGEGNIFTAGNILTTDIKIGSFNIFNLNGTVGHDTIIGDCNVFNPTNNISGNVIIKNKVLIGTGAQVLQELTITDDTIIGAGTVVTKDITESGVYVGSPAKKMK